MGSLRRLPALASVSAREKAIARLRGQVYSTAENWKKVQSTMHHAMLCRLWGKTDGRWAGRSRRPVRSHPINRRIRGVAGPAFVAHSAGLRAVRRAILRIAVV